MLALLITMTFAADPGPPLNDAATAEDVARLLRGKVAIVHDSVVNIDDLKVVPHETTFELRAHVSPLFVVKDLRQTMHKNAADGVAHYTLVLSEKCGEAGPYIAPGRAVVVDAANALLLDADRFRWVGELASPALKERAGLYVNPQQLLTPNDLKRVQECARQRARAASDKSHTVTMFVGDEQRASIRVGVDPRTVVIGGDVGEGWENMRFVIAPANGVVVERQSVSIMQCSDEGPHTELYDWKQGTSAWKPLTKGKPGEFVVDTNPFADVPPFPKYTAAELQKAKPERYAPESCAPQVGIIRFRVRFGAETVQTIEIQPAMGC